MLHIRSLLLMTVVFEYVRRAHQFAMYNHYLFGIVNYCEMSELVQTRESANTDDCEYLSLSFVRSHIPLNSMSDLQIFVVKKTNHSSFVCDCLYDELCLMPKKPNTHNIILQIFMFIYNLWRDVDDFIRYLKGLFGDIITKNYAIFTRNSFKMN